MSRSRLAYPLARSADMDVGGAADLQTDVMRFMAILALCLVAIFALVQSIPLAPREPPTPEPDTPVETEPPPPAAGPTRPAALEPRRQEPAPQPTAPAQSVTLTRPKWQPQVVPQEPVPAEAAAPPAEPAPAEVSDPEVEGFTLRFASDAALTRAVAARHVGFYAILGSGAKRMMVSESRISFWDASTPNSFHEMEAATVPRAVADALARSGAQSDVVSWGVTLPGKMTARLEQLMREHRGGSLIIGAGGNIEWEAS